MIQCRVKAAAAAIHCARCVCVPGTLYSNSQWCVCENGRRCSLASTARYSPRPGAGTRATSATSVDARARATKRWASVAAASEGWINRQRANAPKTRRRGVSSTPPPPSTRPSATATEARLDTSITPTFPVARVARVAMMMRRVRCRCLGSRSGPWASASTTASMMNRRGITWQGVVHASPPPLTPPHVITRRRRIHSTLFQRRLSPTNV